ncbi:regulatory-associated protein of mTOR isoform X2 [Cimex lectularius]|uniref:Raptor N-terminal CASPase-like domain-containing protein n=1 Tax=Cimex lectularius TaxID=79782 RepID=A0A8I6SL09_CIMLE|nr:regulatory-associated protein of mTOR isoform X2 [Cimex lectularius]
MFAFAFFRLLTDDYLYKEIAASACEKKSEEEESAECSDWNLPLAFSKKRHVEPIEGETTITQTWRMKERMKTVSVALVICLNVGVDPPDIVKTQPCARLECWIDPMLMSPQKSLEAIGANLQKQYERWQPRARYKQSLDPTVEEVKKLCTSLRRNAKEERVLFHYNGHGVPKPTTNGEIWVFNRQYTQYIPLSIYDLQSWMGAPSIYVYDCSNAGVIVDLFKQFADQHEKDYEQNAQARIASPPPNFRNCIQLAACSADQILPMNPDLPADLFTSCLTTPIKIALRWFVMQNNTCLVPKISLEAIDKIPGQLNDRRTMLGELNWIFTAITDTIAWNTLPRDLFQKLFRQDLLVASLFRNFLLAERIMRSYGCCPVSSPALPSMYQHPMWQAWDLAVDLCLAQLLQVVESEDNFVHSPFFEEQLTAFQVWLTLGSETKSPPEQLPIVLQVVLLSQVHRLRALELLGKFLDLGPWAVNLALSVGIFPYVLKLLQSSAKELRPLLVFIWAKILAVDSTCQTDLVRDNGHRYFLSVLQDTGMPSEERTLAAFVLACMVDDYPGGQEAAMQGSLVSICLDQLEDESDLLRQWLAIALGRLWRRYDKARWCGVRDSAHEKLYRLLKDPVPEVRAASVFALGTFIDSVSERSMHANNIDHSVAMTLLNTVAKDMSPLVRKELVVALQNMVLVFENSFLSIAMQELRDGAQIMLGKDVMLSPGGSLKRNSSRDRLMKALTPSLSNNYNTITGVMAMPVTHSDLDGSFERLKRVSSSSSISSLATNTTVNSPGPPAVPFGSAYQKVWVGLTSLDVDPFPGVSNLSRSVTDHIRDQVCAWPGQSSPPHSSGAWGVSLSMSHLTAKESTSPREVTEVKASSLPPSPSNRSYLNESPPPISTNSREKLGINRSVQLTPRSKKPLPNTINEDAVEESTNGRKTLVSTQFVDWSCKYFAQPIKGDCIDADVESTLHYQREWRFLRNAELRREAKEEQVRLFSSKLETQLFYTRCSAQPISVKFHPYEPHLAIAYKDTFTIWDYQNSAKVVTVRGERSMGTNGRKVTCLEYINAHDVSLMATGSDDGAVRIWKHDGSLLTAWQAMPQPQHSVSKSHHNAYSSSITPGIGVLGWDQTRLNFIIGGDSRSLKIWDANAELSLSDIPTGADAPVTSISIDPSGGYKMSIGCADGTVRLFDRRLSPHEARIMTYREHSARIVNVQLSHDSTSLLSGSTAGDVRIFDTRKHTASLACQSSQGQGLKAMAVHTPAEIFACGSVNQISLYKWSGAPLYIIKSVAHEWFSSSKFGPVGCLSFHPYKALLAAGSADSTLSVYSLDPRR